MPVKAESLAMGAASYLTLKTPTRHLAGSVGSTCDFGSDLQVMSSSPTFSIEIILK